MGTHVVGDANVDLCVDLDGDGDVALTRLLTLALAQLDHIAYVHLCLPCRVTPPTVHQMVLALERAGLIRRQPGVARSIEVLVAPETRPVLR